MRDTVLVKDTAMRKFIAELFQSLGVPHEDAWTAARVLVRADLRGVESHGINNLFQYVDPLCEGTLNPRPDIQIVRESPITALVDGDGGMGLVIGVKAMKLCLAKAQEHGLAAVAVRRSKHYGIASYYSMMALEHDMIGLSMTNNAKVSVVPTFGKQAMMSTNPISVVVPTDREPPFEMDFATSVVAISKIGLALAKDQEHIPVGWALDEEGRSTGDAQRAWESHRLLPLGGTRELGSHKGYGLGALVDILTGVLSGGMYSNLAERNPPEDHKLRTSSSHFFAALRVDFFRPLDEFKAAMDDMLRALKDSEKAEGQERIYTHGEIEFETERERLENGIPYHVNFIRYLRGLADEFDVPFEIEG
jgi:LDH2 family malate/lactate/ureidoglycolate dehydrogenase